MRLLTLVAAVLAAGCGGPARGAGQAGTSGQDTFAIHASLVGDAGARDGWLVFDRSGISCVACTPAQVPADARRIEYDGYVFPNLIDTHNHIQWNAIPQWRAGRTFDNRYQWIDDPAYQKAARDAFTAVTKAGLVEAALQYGEIRALVGATTLIQSTYQKPEPPFLARNLDATYGADSRIPDIALIPDLELQRFRAGLASGATRRIFLHIGEGKGTDARTAAEFGILRQKGLVRPGVVVIHGVGLTRADFAEMATAGMFLVWSPKSNEVLYGVTANVTEAMAAGVTVALAPDWTISGSDNALEEMKVADQHSRTMLAGAISPARIFRMVTSDAARVAGVAERLGRIGFGYAADVFLAPKLDQDPHNSLLKTLPKDIHLVFVDGVPLYGDAATLTAIHGAANVDEIAVEQSKKAIRLVGGRRYADLVKVLSGSLPTLAPLIEP